MKKRSAPVGVKHVQAEVVKKIGERLREARELCGISQIEAAKRMGYANSSRLARIERGSDTSVPLWLIVKAAKVYEVSIDFLFGAADDWYSSPRMRQEREVSSWLFDAWEQQRKKDMELLKAINDRLQSVTNITGETLDQAVALDEAFNRFMGFSGRKFDDLKGSATVVKRIEDTVSKAKTAKEALDRFRTDIRRGSGSNAQLELFDDKDYD